MKKFLAIAILALGLTATGCTAAQLGGAHSIVDVAGDVCQVIVAATDPVLAPLCTTATGIANAVTALLAAHGPVKAGAEAYAPSSDEIYQYLATHGAKYVKH